MSEEIWVEVRDRGGRLLFKYNPQDNVVEIKKGGDTYTIVKLDEIRRKHGVIPPSLQDTEHPVSPLT